MSKRVVFAIVSILGALIQSNQPLAALELPSNDGRVAWTVPLDPGLNVRICREGRRSWFNMGGDSPGATSLHLVATIEGGRVVDLNGYDDLCGKPRDVRTVGPFATAETVAWLVERIEQDSPVAEDALGILGVVDHASIPVELERFARSHRSEDIRGNAVFLSTVRIGSGAIPLIRDVLRDERSREVREKAIFSLSEIEDPVAAELLRSVARSDRDGEMRAHAVFWVGESQGREALEFLRSLVGDENDEEIIEAVVFGISQVEGNEAARMLVDLAKSHIDPDVRKKAIFWLAERASEHLESAVDEILTDEDEDVLEAAVFAVARLPEDESIPILLRLATTHASAEVREQAVFWLGQKDDPRAVEALESIILN